MRVQNPKVILFHWNPGVEVVALHSVAKIEVQIGTAGTCNGLMPIAHVYQRWLSSAPPAALVAALA